MAQNNRKTVLLVDDDIMFLNVLANEFKVAGFDVKTAKSISGAKKIVAKKGINIVILDVWLKIGDNDVLEQGEELSAWGGYRSGQVLALWLKTKYPDITFIAYSNSSSEEVIDWFHKNGGGFLSKLGNKPSHLVKYIRRVLGIGMGPKSFIVHGHDELTKLNLKNCLQNTLKLPEPTILHEQPNAGRTIIEKFEEEAEDIDLVFVLLTGDDKGRKKRSNKELRRARQNVIFEMGYFLGKIGRKRGRVILLYQGNLELPSDISGLIYIDISKGFDAACEAIRKEIAEFLPS